MADVARTVQRKLKATLDSYQRVMARYPALLGDGNGNVNVTDRPGYVYARIDDPDLGRSVLQLWNSRVAAVSDLPVWIGYTPEAPRLFQVLDVQLGAVGIGDSGETVYSTVPLHAETHRYFGHNGGNDVLWVESRQLYACQVAITGTFTATVRRGIVYTLAGWVNVAETAINLTAYVPTTVNKALFALIYLNTNGGVSVELGAQVSVYSLAITDIPTVASGWIPLAAVRLYTGQTALSESATNTDIVELRFPWHPTSVPGTLTDLGNLESELDYEITRLMLGKADAGTVSDSTKITILDAGGAAAQYFPATDAGMISALAASTIGDLVILPVNCGTLTGPYTVPSGVHITANDIDTNIAGTVTDGTRLHGVSYQTVPVFYGHTDGAGLQEPSFALTGGGYIWEFRGEMDVYESIYAYHPSGGSRPQGKLCYYTLEFTNITNEPDQTIGFTATSGSTWRFGRYGTAPGYLKWVYGSTDLMTLLQSGYLGIGTTSPDRLLHVEDTTASSGAVVYARRISRDGLGLAIGDGIGDEYELETATSTVMSVAGATAVIWTDPLAVSLKSKYDILTRYGGTLETALSVDYAGLTLGRAADGVDFFIKAYGYTASGYLYWIYADDRWKFSDDVLMDSTERIYFRDSAINIYSADDGHLDLTADVSIDLNVVAKSTGRQHAVVVKTATYTATAADEIIVCNKATAMTIDLPAATGSGQWFAISNIGLGVVTVDASGAETINGDTTQTVDQWACLQIADYAAGAWTIL